MARAAVGEELLKAQHVEGEHFELGTVLQARGVERRDHRDPAVVVLEVQQWVVDRYRNLVAQLGGAQGAAPDQDAHWASLRALSRRAMSSLSL